MFSIPVSIISYFITTGSGWSYRPNSWIINVSLDNKTWKTVDTKEKDAGGNTNSFSLSSVVPCSLFRIVFKKSTSNCLVAFTNFDCFGKNIWLYSNK